MDDPANAFDAMHQSWIPKAPKDTSGLPDPAHAGSFDGLTGADFMALSDPGQAVPDQGYRSIPECDAPTKPKCKEEQ